MLENNLFLQSILNKFVLTTNLQIACLDKDTNFNNIITLPNNTLKEDYFNLIKPQLLNLVDFKRSSSIKFIELDFNTEIATILIDSNYFILGPFIISDYEQSTSKYPYRPKFSIKYIVEILISIINDSKVFAPKYNEPFFNLHIKKAIIQIHSNYGSDLTIDSMSKFLNIHKSYFCSSFKEQTGTTFTNFLSQFRVEKSKELLKDSSLSLLDVAIAVGFNNQSYYTMIFKKIMNVTPLQYRRSLNLTK